MSTGRLAFAVHGVISRTTLAESGHSVPGLVSQGIGEGWQAGCNQTKANGRRPAPRWHIQHVSSAHPLQGTRPSESSHPHHGLLVLTDRSLPFVAGYSLLAQALQLSGPRSSASAQVLVLGPADRARQIGCGPGASLGRATCAKPSTRQSTSKSAANAIRQRCRRGRAPLGQSPFHLG